MKNLFKNKLTALAVLATVFFASCGGKDPVNLLKPEIKVTSVMVGETKVESKGEVEAGSDVKFKLNVTSKTTLTAVFLKINDENQPNVYSSAADKDVKISEIPYTFKADEKYVGKDAVKFMFIAQDSLKQKDTAIFELKVVKTAKDAKKLTAQLLYVPLKEDGTYSTNKSFFSIAEGKSYSNKDISGSTTSISPKIDLCYYYGSDNNATLTAPSSYNAAGISISKWGTKNKTKMFKIENFKAEDYTAIKSTADVEAEVKKHTLAEGARLTGLNAGDVIAFETVSTPVVKGLIKVIKVSGTYNSTDYIELEFITNQEALAASAK